MYDVIQSLVVLIEKLVFFSTSSSKGLSYPEKIEINIENLSCRELLDKDKLNGPEMKNKYIVDDYYATKLYLFNYALTREIAVVKLLLRRRIQSNMIQILLRFVRHLLDYCVVGWRNIFFKMLCREKRYFQLKTIPSLKIADIRLVL